MQPFLYMTDHTLHLWQGCEAASATPSPSQEAAKKSSGAPAGDSLCVGDALSDVPSSGSSVPRVTASGAAAESADRSTSDRAVGKAGTDTGEVIWLFFKVLCFCYA